MIDLETPEKDEKTLTKIDKSTVSQAKNRTGVGEKILPRQQAGPGKNFDRNGEKNLTGSGKKI